MVDFELDGRRVSLSPQEPGADRFRVLVDGVPVPMELTRTNTRTGNLGTTTREIAARHPAEWVQIEGEPSEPSVYGSRKVYIHFHLPTTYIYNTAVWCAQSVCLTFAEDFSGVSVLWDESIDDST
ncbi:hypothetical protein ACQEU3_43420 [Spirillospora sp. CA-253888]